MKRTFFAGLLLAVIVAAACGDEPSERLGCRIDDDCDPASACTGRLCVPRALGEQDFVIDLVPATGAGARLTVASRRFTAAPIELTLPARGEVAVRIVPSDLSSAVNEALGSRLAVVLQMPAPLPGLPPLQFETVAVGGDRGTPARAVLSLPMPLIGQAVLLLVRPPPPLDRALPPLFASAPLTSPLQVALPGTATVFTLEGNLQSALRQPLAGFEVRAYRAGVWVSNRAITQVDGTFRLVLPRPPDGQALAPIDLRAALPAGVATAPELHIDDLPASAESLADLRLPPFPGPRPLRVPVLGESDGQPTVVRGARVELTTELEGAARGRAIFRRGTFTDGNGIAELSAIPGSVQGAQSYRVRIVPPPTSRFATTCVSAYPVVGAGVGTDTLVGAPLMLGRRFELRGTVRGPDGEPAAGVAISAEPQPNATADACGGRSPGYPGSAASDEDGRFSLWLDPGGYVMSYRPPEAGLWARKQEPLSIDRGIDREIVLPPGRLAEGRVLQADGQPASRCEVRVYAFEAGRAAALVGHALTDGNGRFRAVLPMP